MGSADVELTLVDRERIVVIIREVADWLTSPGVPVPPVERAEDPPTVFALLEAACWRNDITLEQYQAALQSDPLLAELERQAMITQVVEEPDPGPYDAISRESPSGQPGDLTKSRSVPRSESPGGS